MKYKVWVSVCGVVEEEVIETTGMWPSIIDERDFLINTKQDEMLKKMGVKCGWEKIDEESKEEKRERALRKLKDAPIMPIGVMAVKGDEDEI